MKSPFLAIVLGLSLSLNNTYATNDFSSFSAELKSASEEAMTDMAKQVAIKINLSDIQRMLAQKMAKEALLIALAVDVEQNKTALTASAKQFEDILIGLQTGDEDLKVTETKSTKVNEQLTKISTLWDDFKPHVTAIINDVSDKTALANIVKQNIPLLNAIDQSVTLYGSYCGKNLNGLAAAINLSGRQRMLTQKMTKEFLLISHNNDKTQNQALLATTIQNFDNVLTSLVKGDKKQKLPKIQDKATLEQFNKVQTEWELFKPRLEEEEANTASLQKTATMSLSLLAAMDKAVKTYNVQ